MSETHERCQEYLVPFLSGPGFEGVNEGFGASGARMFPGNSADGFKSLIMRHTVQRNVWTWRGHLITESHVLHLPVTRSFSACC